MTVPDGWRNKIREQRANRPTWIKIGALVRVIGPRVIRPSRLARIVRLPLTRPTLAVIVYEPIQGKVYDAEEYPISIAWLEPG